MRVACLVLSAATLALSPWVPLGLDLQEPVGHAAHGQVSPPLVRAVQDATRQYVDDLSAAGSAGYEPFLGCVSGPQEGATGVHYVNDALVHDGRIEVGKPEALMYEMRDGKMVLLEVEYIVPVAAWQAHTHPHPPELMGQVFTYNESPNRYGLDPFYALHVWAWRPNPRGTFVDWNPDVTCDGFVPTS
jgi:hypothetical protein